MNKDLEFRVKQWERSLNLNQDIPLEEFCADRPELLPEFTEIVKDIQGDYALRESILGATFSGRKGVSDYKPKDYGLPDQIMGRYELNSLLGRGHFGSVWCAKDLKLSRDVAIKFPFTYLLFNEARINDFLREAEFLAKVSLISPHFVAVYHSGFVNDPDPTEPNIPFIVMELMEGTLAIRSSKKLFKSPKAVAEAVIKLGKALHAAHVCESAPLIHRDIKPSNIFYKHDVGVGKELQIKLGDFGLVLNAEVPPPEDYRMNGVLEYMSPERLNGIPCDVRSDIYSLGVVFYQLLTGSTPFDDGGDSFVVIENIMKGSFLPPATVNPELNEYLSLQRICQKAMAADPNLRYDNAALMVDDLEQALRNDSSV